MADIYWLLNNANGKLGTNVKSINRFDLIHQGMNNRSVERLIKQSDLEMFVDESGMIDELPQNDSGGQLANAVNGHKDIIYGPVVIVAKTAKAKLQIERWINLVVDNQLTFDDDIENAKYWRSLGQNTKKQKRAVDSEEQQAPVAKKQK